MISIVFAVDFPEILEGDECGEEFMKVSFMLKTKGSVCEVRLSDENMKRDGLLLLDKVGMTPRLYCLNPGYYYIGCTSAGTVNVAYLDYNQNHELKSYPCS